MKPRISVIIPAFNEEKLIGKCLTHLRDQTLDRAFYEIVVVDNGSIDKTPEIAKKYADQVLPYTKEHKVASVRNYGVSQTESPLLAFMDADTLAEKHWLEEIYHLFEKDSLQGACGVALPLNNTVMMRIHFSLYNFFLRTVYSLFDKVVCCWGCNMAFRRSALERTGGFSRVLTSSDDTDQALRVQEAFGKRSMVYSQKMKVYTSTRKQEKIQYAIPYYWEGALNLLSILLYKKVRITPLKNVR